MSEPSPERLFTAPFVRLLCAQTLAGFAVYVFNLLPKFLAVAIHATPSQIGWVSASYGAAGAVATPLLTMALDRSTPRSLIILSFATVAWSSAAFVWVDRIGPLAVTLRALQGLAWAAMFTAGMTLTMQLAPPRRLAQAIGYYGLTNVVMNAVGPATAEILAERAGYDPVFLLAGVTGAAAVALGYRLPADRPPAAPSAGIFALARRPSSIVMLIVVTLWGVAFGAMFVFHQPFALLLGIRNVRRFFIAYTAAAVIARVGAGDLIDRVGRYRVSVASLGLYALVVLSMQWFGPSWLEPVGALFGLAHGLFFPAYSALIVERAPLEERGKLTALSNAGFGAGFAGGSVLLGYVAETSGFARVYLSAGLMTVAALVVLVGAASPRPRTIASSPLG